MRKDIKADASKGVQMGNSPYLWKENSVNPYTDAVPSEKFVPTPSGDVGDDFKVKRIIWYAVIGLLVVFAVCVLIAIWKDTPQTLFRGDSGKGHFFR